MYILGMNIGKREFDHLIRLWELLNEKEQSGKVAGKGIVKRTISGGGETMDKEYTIQNTYEVTQTQEVSIDWNGYYFLVIYGRHVNGWFIAIPNWQVCVEAAHPTEVFYNTKQLGRELGTLGQAGAPALAKAIKEHWEGLTSQ